MKIKNIFVTATSFIFCLSAFCKLNLEQAIDLAKVDGNAAPNLGDIDVSDTARTPKFSVSEATQLLELKSQKSLAVDALWLADKNLLIISKQGSPPEALVYNIDFAERSASLIGRQSFEGFAPMLMKNRDFVLAFKVFSPNNASPAELFRIDNAGSFQSLHIFANQDVKNIAATEKSNFVATIDYAQAKGDAFKTARLKLFTTSASQLTLKREGGALGVMNMRQNQMGRVTALAMSPMGRVGNAPYNRALALFHSAGTNHALHVWYFPSIKEDFTLGRGHRAIPMSVPFDTLEFSPNTPGLLLAANKARGELYLLQFDFDQKALTKIQALPLEKSKAGPAFNIAARFGKNDAIIVGAGNSVILYQKDKDGNYEKVDVQPADLEDEEYFSKIDVSDDRFIIVGTKGSVQFGKISE